MTSKLCITGITATTNEAVCEKAGRLRTFDHGDFPCYLRLVDGKYDGCGPMADMAAFTKGYEFIDAASYLLETIPLKLGRMYRQRNGEIVGPLQQNTATYSRTHPYLAWVGPEYLRSWTASGVWGEDGKTPNELDITEEIPMTTEFDINKFIAALAGKPGICSQALESIKQAAVSAGATPVPKPIIKLGQVYKIHSSYYVVSWGLQLKDPKEGVYFLYSIGNAGSKSGVKASLEELREPGMELIAPTLLTAIKNGLIK